MNRRIERILLDINTLLIDRCSMPPELSPEAISACKMIVQAKALLCLARAELAVVDVRVPSDTRMKLEEVIAELDRRE